LNKKTKPIKSNVIKKNTVDFKNMEKEKKRKKTPKKPQHHTVGTVPKSKIVETEAKSIPLTLISMTTYFYALVQALQYAKCQG
jgi:hypothetical protein